jgi:sulfoxide reductase heme-binding subunit YedZ
MKQAVSATRAIELRRTRVTTAAAALAFTAVFWFIQVGPQAFVGGESTSHAFSDTTRNLGFSALIVLSASLPLGLVVGRRLVHGRRAAILYAAHRTLSMAALAIIGLHLVTLLGATSLGPSLARLAIPFLWPHRTLATGLGVLGTWILIALGPSYYLRRRFGARHWKIAHRLIAIGLLLALVHSLGGG